MAGKTIEGSQAVDHKVSLGSLLDQFLYVLAGGDVISEVHQGDRVVKVLFNRLELRGGRTLEILVADAEVNGCAIAQLLTAAGKNLLKHRFGLVEFVLLQGAQSGFVVLQSLGCARIVRQGRFFWISLL